jgi:hypothetical protein
MSEKRKRERLINSHIYHRAEEFMNINITIKQNVTISLY